MRLIDADVAEKILREYADDVGCNRGEYELANGILKAVCKLDDIPTVEAKPVVYGEWLEVKGVLSWFYKCSECGMFHEYKRKFCNGCGADMRKKVE